MSSTLPGCTVETAACSACSWTPPLDSPSWTPPALPYLHLDPSGVACMCARAAQGFQEVPLASALAAAEREPTGVALLDVRMEAAPG